MVAMIGYLQEHSTRYWHRQINEWISELADGKARDACVWGRGEILELAEENVKVGAARYHSVHGRTGDAKTDHIEIHHLWIDMNRTTPVSANG